MNIGFMGLGKLGLPCALSIEKHGHRVIGSDPSPQVANILQSRELPYKEVGAQDLLDETNIQVVGLPRLVEHSDIIFVAIQTPHDPKFEGVTPLPRERKDFSYDALVGGLKQLSDEVKAQKKPVTVVVISTVLPGTVSRDIKPILDPNITLCYNPFFIAMGTTIHDFENPEFVLLGADGAVNEEVRNFYSTIHKRPVFECTIEEAELIKVSYNTYIGLKIVFANTVMEIADKLKGIDCDKVIDALSMADQRLMSPKYLRGGMGDGGGCHPRDNIALSWLARKLELKYDLFEEMMKAREKQTERMRDMLVGCSHVTERPIIILGKAFKPETNLTVGSPAVLLYNMIHDNGMAHFGLQHYDPHVDEKSLFEPKVGVYFIATKHECFKAWKFPAGSIVIDPWRYIPDQEGVDVRRIGSRDRGWCN